MLAALDFEGNIKQGKSGSTTAAMQYTWGDQCPERLPIAISCHETSVLLPTMCQQLQELRPILLSTTSNNMYAVHGKLEQA
jgi:hypothetical protein